MKRLLQGIAIVAAMFACASAQAARVYVLSSNYAVQDNAVLSSLAAAGHTGTIGVPFNLFDGTVSLIGYDAVLLQANYNWTAGDMPVAGQSQIVSYIQNGGGVVTAEWYIWLTASGRFQTLDAAMPTVATTSYNGDVAHHLMQITADPTVNSGLPSEFDVQGDNVAGGETMPTALKAGAVEFYRSTHYNTIGLCGRDFGQGRIAQFSQTVGENFLGDAFGFRLLGNVIEWVSHGSGARQVNPDSFTVRLGQVTSGGLAQIADIDGHALRVCKFIVPNQIVAPITVEVDGTSPIASPIAIQFRTYSQMSVTGSFSVTLDLYNWTTNAFSATAVNTTPITNVWKAAGVAADAPIARFISGTNKMRARYRVRQTGPASSNAWCNDLDQAVWFVRQ